MLVLSSPSVENRNITSYLGIVTGSTVRARHVGSDILASLKNLVGGELQSYSKLLSSALLLQSQLVHSPSAFGQWHILLHFLHQRSVIFLSCKKPFNKFFP